MTHQISKFRILLFLSVLIFHNSCKKESKPQTIDPAFAGYISAFTTGIISNQDPITVRLTEPREDVLPGDIIEDELFQFSPSIEGQAHWVDNQTIEFQPKSSLPSGKLYEAQFHLEKLMKVPSQLSILVFKFQVLKQSVDLSFEGMSAYDPNDLKWQKIQLTAHTGDFASSESVQKAFEVFQNGKTLLPKWEHSPDGRTHNFTIDSVRRGKDKSELFVKWNKKDLSLDLSGEQSFRIPPLGEFRVVEVKVKNQPRQAITIHFSDPLQKDIDLNGLIHLTPEVALKFVKNPGSVTVYPSSRLVGTRLLTITDGVRNSLGFQLTEEYTQNVEFNNLKPAIELLGNGVILPNSNGLHFPFKAVNLDGVNVKIIKIFEKNIAQFLQVNQLDGDRELKRVGRIVYKGEVPLTSEKAVDYGTWNSYSIDLSNFINVEPGAIYRVSLSFSKKHSLYPCENDEDDSNENEIDYPLPDKEDASYDGPNQYYYYDDYYDYWDGYNYKERNDPCKASYYASRGNTLSRNILASDLGIIAKGGNGTNLLAAVTDLRTTMPVSAVDVDIYNYQNKLIGSATTNSQGFVEIPLDKKPFLLIAKQGTQRGYLRLDDGSSLSLSMFDVGGKKSAQGIKGFIYGERGVWRPGDTLNLTFILEDKHKKLPSKHPILVEFVTPQGQLYHKHVVSKSTNGFYNISQTTERDAPTGNWMAKVKVGASEFSKSIRIESVKPNKLKIDLDFKKDFLASNYANIGDLMVKWLHGADAPNLKADIELKLFKDATSFKNFEGYSFDDASKKFQSKETMIYEGTLDHLGKAKIYPKISVQNAPGMLTARFKVRAFEKSGDFSVDRKFITFSPYRSYVGVKIPEGKGWNGALYSDEPNVLSIATLDEQGNPVDKSDLKVEIFDINWRWWWQRSESDDLAQYVQNTSRNLRQTQTVSTKNGKALFELKFNEQTYGRKYIRITDPSSGHSCGQSFYVTYKSWWNDNGANNPAGAEMLTFSTDKKDYKIGEKIKVKLPASTQGRALVSVESGSKILKHFWMQASKTQNSFEILVTEKMVPNVFINISLIQPHASVKNDLPIRLYGVQTVNIENEASRLNPQIKVASELKPEKDYTVSVSEKDGRPMTYTLAVVDEGILDLTRFKTPDPNDEFYAKEALGIKTWDMYKYVIGAQSGEIAGLLAIGGDQYIENKDANSANRFKPVVQFLGPFNLKSGKTSEHVLTMPNYIGAVRVMVVAGNKGSYGKTDKSVPVRKPLMVSATLPRVVGPGEKLKLPVTVFAMKNTIRNVQVGVKSGTGIEIIGDQRKSIRFDKIGDQVVEFDLEVTKKLGINKVEVWAKSGNEKSTYEIEISTRASNPRISKTYSKKLDPGEAWNTNLDFVGMSGTNLGSIELSSIPPLNLEERLQYLIHYPHGCIEQTTSSVFPQLYLNKLLALSDEEGSAIEGNIKAAINRMRRFQLNSGAMSYWPGGLDASDWGTTYAGHFLLEAKALGYVVPNTMLGNWKQYQTDVANRWTNSNNHDRHNATDLQQAYRLYTLALSKSPALGAMNRMRQTSNISDAAKWRLAAAYQLIGKVETARNLVAGLNTDLNQYSDRSIYHYTYGSVNRDKAMILETMSLMGKRNEAKTIYESLTESLRSRHWHSTQTTAYMLIAICQYLNSGPVSKTISYIGMVNGENVKSQSTKTIQKVDIKEKGNNNFDIQLQNKGTSALYIQVSLSGIPMISNEQEESKNLNITTRFTDLSGALIDPNSIKQGTDFKVRVSIKHPGTLNKYENLALTQIFPSGWEIRNLRMDSESGENDNSSNDAYDYQDIRDDRVLTYFSLGKNKAKTFTVVLHAAYKGKYYLPSTYCAAMYDNDIRAIRAGKWVEVVE